MQDSNPDKFDYRRPGDYVLVVLGMIYTLCLPIIWTIRLLQWIGSVLDNMDVDSATYRPRRAYRSSVARSKPYRFRAPKRTPIRPYKSKPAKPIISTTSRWVKSLGRYQSRHYNRLTGRTTVSPRVRDLEPKK